MISPKELFEQATAQRKTLLKKWDRYLIPVAEAYKEKHGRAISPFILENTAMCLENIGDWVNEQKSINETTYSDAISFVNYGFRVIAALMPTLIANDIVSVQPMDRRTGQIFYLNYLAGTTKGNITEEDVLMGAKTGPQGKKYFSAETVPSEVVATGNGSATNWTSKSLTYKPIRINSVTVVATLVDDSVETMTDDGAGNLVSDTSGGSGKIAYTTGVITTITFSQAVKNGTTIKITYDVNFEKTTIPDNIPQIDLALTSETVTAKTRKLRARWLLDAAYDLQKAHGITAESELLVAITSEVKHEIDVEICDALLALGDTTTGTNPGAGTVSFDAAAPTVGSSGTVFPWVWQKEGIMRTMSIGAQKIFQATKRAIGNYVICSTDVAALISTLDHFKPSVDLAAQPPTGPFKMGDLQGMYGIYVNPFYDSGRFLVGFRGDSFLNAGFVYAPYLPIFVTPTIILDDFVYRRGIATSYALKELNSRFYVGGTMSNIT